MKWFVILSILVPALGLQASVKLPDIISDNMMLQADKPAAIWGWADPGEQISVGFAGQKKDAVADESGAWKVLLDPMPASGTAVEMVIHSSTGNQQSTMSSSAMFGLRVANPTCRGHC